MFSRLSDKLSGIFGNLTNKGRITEADVETAVAEIRSELLDADVSLQTIKPFLEKIKREATGDKVLQSITPGQQIIKITHDAMVELLQGEEADNKQLNFAGEPPHVILLAGLQGSGKTTTAAKLALYLRSKHKLKVMMASLDTARAAAQSQLQSLGEAIDCPTLPIIEGQLGKQITERALSAAKLQGFDVLILDSAGRLQIDTALMHELQDIQTIANPKETLLVADSMMGQSAADMAASFHRQITLSGIILTRIDGDARGGAALSMRAVSGVPIRFFGTGEKPEAFEEFHAKSLADRILGMGDVVSLVEKAQEAMQEDEAEALSQSLAKGQFTMDDMAKQLKQVKKMGGMSGIMAMMPGMGGMKKQLAQHADDSMITKNTAIISSMTAKERANPKIIHASRKQRIAKGSGTQVQDVNKLLKQHLTMSKMVKKLQRMDKKQAMRSMQSVLGGTLPPNSP